MENLPQTKFGRVPGKLKEHLKSLKDKEQIKQATRKILSSETIEEYMAKLEQLSRA